MSETKQPETTSLRIAKDRNPYAAVGRAAGMLMVYPSFGDLPFGQVMKIIAGQINRGHYCFVFKDNNAVGFFGWAYTSQTGAENWLMNNDESGIGDGIEGDCVVFNIWHTDGPKTNSFAVTHMRSKFSDKKMLYAKRRYNDGRVKPIRIPNMRM